MADQLGPLVRLWGLSTAQLPPTTAAADDLAPFLISILQEAVPFIDSVTPKNPDAGPPGWDKLWKAKGIKSYPNSTAKVEVRERVVPVPELELIVARNGLEHGQDGKIPPETWACRRSVHEDNAKNGTACWDEFVRCFKERHAESEEEFTPTVIGAREAMVWDCSGVEMEEGGERWGDFTLKVEETKHKIGTPLKNRTFPTLQMTASAAGSQEFLVVSIAITDFASSAQAQFAREKGVIVGAYTSVERIRKLPASGDIEWIMATASDARGSLPLWLQAKAVPGQIAKDVQLFLVWIDGERVKNLKARDEDLQALETKNATAENPKPEEPVSHEDGIDGAKPEVVSVRSEGGGSSAPKSRAEALSSHPVSPKDAPVRASDEKKSEDKTDEAANGAK
jgi:hypothetical protein